GWMFGDRHWSRQLKAEKQCQRRERKPHVGELVQLDGSVHDWLAGWTAGLCDEHGGRRHERNAGSDGQRRDDLGGCRRVAGLDWEAWRATRSLHRLEERV